jgi:hypothetical protein
MYDQRQADKKTPESSDSLTALATLEQDADEPMRGSESTGPRCEKCQAPIKSDVVTICRRCGWYASLGTFVELDPNWEIETEDSDHAPSAAPQKSHLRVWLDLLPRWSWVIIVSVLAVVVESVVVRFVTPADGGLRTTWSLSQLALGALIVAGCHLFNFLVLAAEDADVGALDLFMRPLKLWLRAVHNLPTRLWVANTAACGLAAALMSVLVIGGLPYERLWDWGVQEPVKQNLMGAVMDRVKKLDSRGGSGNLEDAISDFAGSQDVVPGAELPKPKPSKPRSKTDCVILGYQLDREGRLATLLLGTAHRGALVYAGRVTPEMPDEELTALREALQAIKSMQAFISVEAEATWVQPKYTCRVSFGEQQKGGRLRDVRWDRLLGSMETAGEQVSR